MKNKSFALMALLLAGCVNVTPDYDAKFGDAVRTARQTQTLNQNAEPNSDPTLGLDGKASVNALERYQDSFKAPPKTFEINISTQSGN